MGRTKRIARTWIKPAKLRRPQPSQRETTTPPPASASSSPESLDAWRQRIRRGSSQLPRRKSTTPPPPSRSTSPQSLDAWRQRIRRTSSQLGQDIGDYPGATDGCIIPISEKLYFFGPHITQAEARTAVKSIEKPDEKNEGIVRGLTQNQIKYRMGRKPLPREYSQDDVAFQLDGDWYRVDTSEGIVPLFDLPKGDETFVLDDDEMAEVEFDDEGYESEGDDDEYDDPKDGDYRPERCTEKGEHRMVRLTRRV